MLSSLFSFFFSFLSFFLLHSGFFSFSSSRSDGCNAVRASAFFFFSSSSSIKHIWLRVVGAFGFLIHSDFLVEVVVLLRAVGGGGCGCGFLDLPLVVMELG